MASTDQDGEAGSADGDEDDQIDDYEGSLDEGSAQLEPGKKI